MQYSSGMTRFYFHIRDHERLILDEDGLELESIEAAVDEAHLTASAMLLDARASGDDLLHQIIEVTDNGGKVLAAVPFADVT